MKLNVKIRETDRGTTLEAAKKFELPYT